MGIIDDLCRWFPVVMHGDGVIRVGAGELGSLDTHGKLPKGN